MLIPLVCTQCGGSVKAEETIVVTTDNGVIIRAGNQLKCEHCGTQFVAGEELRRGGGVVIASGNRSVAINGGISGGTIITGDNNK